MNKKRNALLSLILLLALLSTLILPAFAAEAEPVPAEATGRELHITSLSSFLNFSKNCVRDKFSEDLTVYLDTNLDLSQVEFQSIPIFTGIFEGNHHTISGLSLSAEGSVQGLFRYLTKGAELRNLTVQGSILPDGTMNTVGSLVGDNAGKISNCRFDGEISGAESIGGIAGINQVSGIIEGCQSSGMIRGTHFVGGTAGENLGVIRFCKNLADINVTVEDNSIETTLDNVELSPDYLMGKETTETVTDLGGIAGTSTGSIRDCTNLGAVGYPHMGYNIGGIAGSQRGYITRCENFGAVSGRKEIGGIAGQMEPVARITYSKDTLQILREQLDTTSSLANRAASHIGSGSQQIGSSISALHGQVGIAIDAVNELLTGGIPDLDSIVAAGNALAGSISSIQNIASSLHGSLQATVSTAAGDIHAITREVSAMSHTLDTAAENLGGTITDISDRDTSEDLSAKVSLCRNHEEILGDLNVGGITGAIAWENDKDPEGDYEVDGERSLNFDSEIRAVILDCQNTGAVTAKKRYAGGIAGNMTMGLAKGCINTGFLEDEGADYLGGIAGISYGYIRSCSSKTRITGHSYLGGIAGQAPVVTNCRSMVEIREGAEKKGSILGMEAENRSSLKHPIAENFYLPLADHLGAIDGIDYYNIADSLSKRAFLALPELSRIFREATMIFAFPDGSTQNLVVPLGEVVSRSRIPEPPRKQGYIARWDHLDEIDLKNVFLDGTLEVEYTPCYQVAESDLQRDSGKPIVLAEGSFESSEKLILKPAPEQPDRAEEAWALSPSLSQEGTVIHLSVPDSLKPKSAEVLVQKPDGSWEKAQSRCDGTYLVFTAEAGDQAMAIRKSNLRRNQVIGSAAGAAVLAAAVGILITLIRRKKKKDKTPKA